MFLRFLRMQPICNILLTYQYSFICCSIPLQKDSVRNLIMQTSKTRLALDGWNFLGLFISLFRGCPRTIAVLHMHVHFWVTLFTGAVDSEHPRINTWFVFKGSICTGADAV